MSEASREPAIPAPLPSPASASAPSSVHAPSSATPQRLDAEVWDAAYTLHDFVEKVAEKSVDLWQTTIRLARISDEARERARAIAAPRRLLVLLEDWCGDAIFTIPFAARIAEASTQVELRVIRRDEHMELMDAHLSGTSRSIPVAIVYDADGVEQGWWGPRPGPLQAWMLRDGLLMEKTERYKAVRTWYARDRGTTTVNELLSLLSLPAR